MDVVQLVLAAEHGADLSPLSQELGAETIQRSQLPAALASDPALRAVIVAPMFTADASRQADMGAALSAWTQAAEAVLNIQKHHRSACVLLLADEVARAPSAAAAYVKAWIEDTPEPPLVSAAKENGSALEAINDLAAHALIAADPRASRAAAELRAAAAPLMEPAELSVSAAWGRAVSRVRQLQAGLDNAAQNYSELALEAQQNEARRSELEAALGAAAQNYAEAQHEIESLSEALEGARGSAEKARAERDRVLEDRNRMSKEGLALRATADRQSEEIALLREMTHHLEAALEETHASTSWRLTAPIRAVKTALARNQADAEPNE